MKHLLLTLSLVSVTMLSGCYYAPVVPPMGYLIAQTTAPLDTDMDGLDLSSLDKGSSTNINILGCIAVGDCSIAEAARNGNLKEVNHADYTYTNIFGIYQSFTTHAYGTEK